MKGGYDMDDWGQTPYRFSLGRLEGNDYTEDFLSNCAKVSDMSDSFASDYRNYTPTVLPSNSSYDPNLFVFPVPTNISAIVHYISSPARCRLPRDHDCTCHPVWTKQKECKVAPHFQD